MQLQKTIKKSKNWIINFENKENECAGRSRIKHLSPTKNIPKELKNLLKKLLRSLIIKILSFLFLKKSYKIKTIYLSKRKFEDHRDLLLMKKENSHHAYIKNFNSFMHNKKSLMKRFLFELFLHLFSSNNVLCISKHQEVYLEVNGMQRIWLPKKGRFSKFVHYCEKLEPSKHLLVFKISRRRLEDI